MLIASPLLVGSPLLIEPARGCPICDTDRGEQVRAGLADGNLGVAVVAVGASFLVIAGVVTAVRFGAPSRPRRGRR